MEDDFSANLKSNTTDFLNNILPITRNNEVESSGNLCSAGFNHAITKKSRLYPNNLFHSNQYFKCNQNGPQEINSENISIPSIINGNNIKQGMELETHIVEQIIDKRQDSKSNQFLKQFIIEEGDNQIDIEKENTNYPQPKQKNAIIT